MATPPRPIFDTLPPELRLQIYSHHLSSLIEDLRGELQHSIKAEDHAVFDPPLLRTSHAFRDEIYPLYLKSMRQAQGIIHDVREETQAKLQRGECFAWDKSSKSFMGGCSGVEVWAMYMRLEGLVRGLEGLEGRVEKWIEGGGSRI